MGSPKALLAFSDERSPRSGIDLICDRLRQVPLNEVIVVLGHEPERILPLLSRRRERVVFNPNPEKGQLSSLIAGLNAVAPDTPFVIVALVDHPLVEPCTYRLLRETAIRHPGFMVIPTYEGRRGHPVVFPSALFDELKGAPPEEGARAMVRENPRRVLEIPVNDPGILMNLNTHEEYARVKSTMKRKSAP